MKAYFKEFREFAVRGNVIDLAIGVIIGAAFAPIVTSMVNDIMMPPIGRLIGNVDFSNLFINISGKDVDSVAQAQEIGAATINYGLFLNHVINFVIVAFVIFFIVKQINRLKREEPVAPPNTKACPYCQTDIPLKASRCPNCTSELEALAEAS